MLHDFISVFAAVTMTLSSATARPLASSAPIAPSAFGEPSRSIAPGSLRDESAWSRTELNAYIDLAREQTLNACAERGIDLPKDFLAWIDGDPIVRASVFGCRKQPLPILLALRSLEIDLGQDIVRRDYTQLALAFAINDSYLKRSRASSPWNDGAAPAAEDALPDITPRPALVLEIPRDPRVLVNTKDATRELDLNDHIINFLEDHEQIEAEIAVQELPPLEYDGKGIAKPQGKAVTVMKNAPRTLVGADVIASASLQAEFNDYMQTHGHAATKINCGDRTVYWRSVEAVQDADVRKEIATAHTMFHDAYRAKGRMPAERDAAPTAAESMAWFIRNDQLGPLDNAKPRAAANKRGKQKSASSSQPFPLNAPWPVLMMLVADDQPLREREEIWQKFRATGEKKTYGEYTGGIAQQADMQAARRVSPLAFNYGSIQMMWKDGGVCGTMGNIGARTHRICGEPSSTAGQPGHCALVLMTYDAKTKRFDCVGEQYATGGDEVTNVHHAWNYDDLGSRRAMVFHKCIAWGINDDFASLLDTMVMRSAWQSLPAEARAKQCNAFLVAGIAKNPFAIALVTASIAAAPDATSAVALLDAFNEALDRAHVGADRKLYRDTVKELVHTRVLELPSPSTPEAAAALLDALAAQQCSNAQLLARCWRDTTGEEGFVENCVKSAQNYLATADRSKSKHDATKFAANITTWSKSIKGKPARKLWASAMLQAFDQKEYMTIKGKPTLDPCVKELCKHAGRATPPMPAPSASAP